MMTVIFRETCRVCKRQWEGEYFDLLRSSRRWSGSNICYGCGRPLPLLRMLNIVHAVASILVVTFLLVVL